MSEFPKDSPFFAEVDDEVKEQFLKRALTPDSNEKKVGQPDEASRNVPIEDLEQIYLLADRLVAELAKDWNAELGLLARDIRDSVQRLLP